MAHLLVVPMDGSHWLSMRSVLVALSQKEHEIVVVAPEVNLNVKASEYYTLKTFDLQATQCPDPPSYVPRTFTDNSDHMTFIQRVENLFFKSSESFLCNFAYLPFELLASDVLRKPVTMKELLSHGSIWLKRMDFVFEYPMPVMPNVVFIGGINCGKKKPLSQVLF
ncbi:UDP-glucuronosyltransferase 1A1-like [Ciconia maguari]